jgi:hypothetical protein
MRARVQSLSLVRMRRQIENDFQAAAACCVAHKDVTIRIAKYSLYCLILRACIQSTACIIKICTFIQLLRNAKLTTNTNCKNWQNQLCS